MTVKIPLVYYRTGGAQDVSDRMRAILLLADRSGGMGEEPL